MSHREQPRMEASGGAVAVGKATLVVVGPPWRGSGK